MLTLNSELATVDAILLTVGYNLNPLCEVITDSEDVATSVLCNWAQMKSMPTIYQGALTGMG